MNSLNQSFDYNLEKSPHSPAETSSSSLSQQLPLGLTGVTVGDNMHKSGENPLLRITLEPERQFYFRYKSENNTNHGYLKGNSASMKTYPTVELVKYTGIAVIRCQLWQSDKNEQHPHKLTDYDDDDEHESSDINQIVPDDKGCYIVQFKRLRIVHTAKKDVADLLFSRQVNASQNMNETQKLRLQWECQKLAKNINLNIVRLRFSAHDIDNMNKEICPPVYSQNILNAKSASTKDLKIFKYIPLSGRAVGGDDMIILTDKIEKRNIQVRFFVLDENGERMWQSNAKFMQSDVHRQSAIAIRTPPYKDPEISSDVKACMELFRPTDGSTSVAKEFTFKALPYYKHNKRRKIVSGGSTLSPAGVAAPPIPIPPELKIQRPQNCMIQIRGSRVPYTPTISETSTDSYMYDMTSGSSSGRKSQQDYANDDSSPGLLDTIDLTADIVEDYFVAPIEPALQDADSIEIVKDPQEDIVYGDTELFHEGPLINNPLLGQPNAPEAIVSQAEESDYGLPDLSEFEGLFKNDFPEYMEPYFIDSKDLDTESLLLSADCGTQKDDGEYSISSLKNSSQVEKVIESEDGVHQSKTAEGPERKTLIQQIRIILNNVNGLDKPEVRDRLERLFELRFPNGDTLLHAILGRDQFGIECMHMVKLIHSVKMPHLLNLSNDLQQSILYLAVIRDLPQLVSFLVSKGCDPMLEDHEGNNAIHIAVIYQNCLKTLLDAIRSNNLTCDLDAVNLEKQTALHLSAIYNSESSARLLLLHGASYNARDNEGRTPLHLATYDDSLSVADALLDFVLHTEERIGAENGIDAVDNQGCTALQIACGGEVRKNTLQIIKRLLAKRADAFKHTSRNEPAWKLAKRKPQMWELMIDLFVPFSVTSDVAETELETAESEPESTESESELAASESEDEFLSADDGELDDALTLKLHKMTLDDKPPNAAQNQHS